MIVLDAAAAVEILLETPRGSRIAEELLEIEDLHAPHLLDAEVTSGLRQAWLRGELDDVRGRDALADLVDLPVTRHSHLLLVGRAWELRQSLSPYDALYVALAERLDAPLLTCDARLARARGHRAQLILR